MAVIALPHEWINYDHLSFSAVAEAAINEAFAAVKAGTAAGSVIQTAATSDGCIGFAKAETGLTFNAAGSVAQIALGDRIQVYGAGNIVWAVAGAAIPAIGLRVMATAGGQVIAHTTGLMFVGVSMSIAAAQHELVAIQVCFGTAL